MSGDIYGDREDFIDLRVPAGKKIKGKIVKLEIKKSDKGYGDYLSMTIECPDYKFRSSDGYKEFIKRGFYVQFR